ncbi:MAG: tRNA lysidine(34) synthetase TilS [Bacteroidales bacterium]|nr:tRNA lysidine(34) synthetase TilS [Bacteroidales bacterium]
MKQVVKHFIESMQICSPSDRLIIALSGGADSVALLRVMLQLGYHVHCVHCNFHLRGDESDRDEHFVRQLCQQLGVDLSVEHFDTRQYAANHHLSIEMAAREQRYARFEEIRLQIGAQFIAVAHHKDDSVETMLLNLVRGTGINGLIGIKPKNGTIVRPLLCVGREQILQYLHTLHQAFVTDSTNLHDDFQRNKIRLSVLPLLKEINPSLTDSLTETASHLRDVAIIYNKVLEEKRTLFVHDNTLCLDLLRTEDCASALLFEMLRSYGFTATQCNNMLGASQGSRFYSVEWQALIDRNRLLLKPKGNTVPLPQLHVEVVEIGDDFVIPRKKELACLDADKLRLPLQVRRWQQGDKFVPFGMHGKKLISDYLTDRKFSQYQKEQTFVVCSKGEIVWIIGERPDNRYRITDNTRRAALIYSISQ